MAFVIVRTKHAKSLNQSIQRLCCPSHLRKEDYTDLYCGMIEHPTLPLTVLCLPETAYVPIHIKADGKELQEIMNIFVQDNAITSQEAIGIISAIQAFAGKQVQIVNFIPPSWTANVLTEEQLQQNGWLPEIPDTFKDI